MSNRAPALDLARFLAALAVVGFHWVYMPTRSGAFAYAFLAVPFFFMASGYLISLSADGRTRAEYSYARVLRLFPVFLMCMAATCLALAVIGHPVSVMAAFANATFFPQAFGHPYVDGVYWTITVEVVFYALVFAVIGRDYRNRLRQMAVAVTGLAILNKLLLGAIPFIGFSPYFAVGIALFLWRREGRPLDLLLLGWFIALSGAAAYFQTHHVVAADPTTTAALAVAMGAALVLIVRVQMPGGAVLAVLGAMTYPVYLLHHEFAETLPNKAVALLAVGALSYGVYWSEERFRAFLRGLKARPDYRYLQPRRIGGSPHLVHVDSDLGIVGQERV